MVVQACRDTHVICASLQASGNIPMYVFDSVPMAVVMVIFFIWYPNQMSLDADPEGSIPLAHSYSGV